jgi:hypothetical protein
MRIKACVIVAAFLAAAVLAAGQARPAKPKKGDPDMVKGPLLRMELLERKEGPPVSAKRDPFVPGGGPAFEDDERSRPRPGAGLAGRMMLGGPVPGAKPGVEAPAEAPPEPALNLRYVGYVRGKAKFLGLVLFNGQAVAVAAGETLGDNWKIVKVDAAEIEVQGPDGAALKFALEGERK